MQQMFANITIMSYKSPRLNQNFFIHSIVQQIWEENISSPTPGTPTGNISLGA